MRIRDLSLKTQLLLAFTAVSLVLIAVSGLAITALQRAEQRFQNFLEGDATREQLAAEVQSAADARAIAARNLVLVTEPSDRTYETTSVQHEHARVSQALAALREATLNGPGSSARSRELFKAIESVEARYGPVALGIIDLAVAGQREQAIQRMNQECRPLLRTLVAATTAYIENGRREARAAADSARDTGRNDLRTLVALATAAVFGALAMGWIFANALTQALARAVQLARAVAAGDLRSEIRADRRDETGQLMDALRAMNDSLKAMVGQVRDSASAIGVAAEEIAQGNQNLSDRTEEQASSVQQTAASMDQMASQLQQAARHAQQARELATAAAGSAESGGAVVQRVVNTMGEISASSARIGDIVGVIEGIAFQTNILALNAAVEAARAGEQGRGFAVVASEVRNLAGRAAEAAREIKAIVSASTQRVEVGNGFVREAGSAMSDLLGRVQHMTGLVTEIDTAARAQSDGIQQVNEAMGFIDQGTQHNAALVEQSAAAAQSLRQQAAQLAQLIARFRMDDDGVAATALPAPAR